MSRQNCKILLEVMVTEGYVTSVLDFDSNQCLDDYFFIMMNNNSAIIRFSCAASCVSCFHSMCFFLFFLGAIHLMFVILIALLTD